MINTRLELMVTMLKEIQAKPPEGTSFSLQDWYCKNECGTTCCAIGYAMQDPRFNELGLDIYRPYGSSTFHGVTKLAPIVRDEFSVSMGIWPDLCYFFRIGLWQVHWLFDTAAYPNRANTTIEEVIERIEHHMHKDQVFWSSQKGLEIKDNLNG